MRRWRGAELDRHPRAAQARLAEGPGGAVQMAGGVGAARRMERMERMERLSLRRSE